MQSASSGEKSSGGSTSGTESGAGDTDILEEPEDEDGNAIDNDSCRSESPIPSSQLSVVALSNVGICFAYFDIVKVHLIFS